MGCMFDASWIDVTSERIAATCCSTASAQTATGGDESSGGSPQRTLR